MIKRLFYSKLFVFFLCIMLAGFFVGYTYAMLSLKSSREGNAAVSSYPGKTDSHQKPNSLGIPVNAMHKNEPSGKNKK